MVGGPAGAWAHGEAAQRKEEWENGFFKPPGATGRQKRGEAGRAEPEEGPCLWPGGDGEPVLWQGASRRKAEPVGLGEAPVTELHQ